MSLIIFSFIGWLIVTEVQTFLTPEITSELFVDDADEFAKVSLFPIIDEYRIRLSIPKYPLLHLNGG